LFRLIVETKDNKINVHFENSLNIANFGVKLYNKLFGKNKFD